MADKGGISHELGDKIAERRESKRSGTLEISEHTTYVGSPVVFRGTQLSPNERYDLVWHTAQGFWGVLQGNEVVGPQFQPRTEHIATVTTDRTGTFVWDWEVQEDYGGEHRVEIRAKDGEPVADARIAITPWFDIDQTAAPLGGSFAITGYGLGPNAITNNYQIAWDNGMVGFVTGTLNHGTATAEIRAVGPVGRHGIQVWRNLQGVPYLQNNTQSPFGPVAGGRQSSWTVDVQEPDSELRTAWMDPLGDERPLEQHYPDVDEESGAELRITPTCGQPGTAAAIRGQNFPAETTVDLVWYTHLGNRTAGTPITPTRLPDVLPTVDTDENGNFEVEVTIPKGVGATRPIVAEVDGRSVAVTGFMMQPKILSFTPTSGPVGTEIDIKLTGVGWPLYENAYFFVYDNRPLGYVCGVDMEKDEDGLVHTVLRAAGAPGYHFIDVYPSIFETHDDEPDFEQKAHLSYRDNHPVRSLPGLHFTFEVTD